MLKNIQNQMLLLILLFLSLLLQGNRDRVIRRKIASNIFCVITRIQALYSRPHPICLFQSSYARYDSSFSQFLRLAIPIIQVWCKFRHSGKAGCRPEALIFHQRSLFPQPRIPAGKFSTLLPCPMDRVFLVSLLQPFLVGCCGPALNLPRVKSPIPAC